MAGAPRQYNRQEIVKRICNELACSSFSIVSVLKSNEDYPGYTAFYEWLAEDKELAEQYARAKEDQADYMAEEILEISDDGRNDWMEQNDKENVGYRFNGESYQRSRLRIDTRKWLASKLKAKKYGDRVNLDHTGGIKVVRINSNVEEGE